MKKEAAVHALYDLGCSIEEIDNFIRIEYIQREKNKEIHKKLAIAEILKDMEL